MAKNLEMVMLHLPMAYQQVQLGKMMQRLQIIQEKDFPKGEKYSRYSLVQGKSTGIMQQLVNTLQDMIKYEDQVWN